MSNFTFFKENPNGIEGAGGVPLGTRIFRSRVQLLGHLQTSPELDKEGALAGSLGNTLHGEVAAMNHENFIVRMYLELVERLQNRAKWNALTEGDRATLQSEVAGLPNQLDTDEIEARMFDMTALRMQLAHVEGDTNTFETRRSRVVEISMLLEEKDTIPAVKAQLEYLAAMQEISFWEDINLTLLEELRIRLRGLVQFLDKRKRKIVYTDFQDEIIDVNEVNPLTVPKMTGPQYAKKVEEYLKSHLDHIAVQKLRQNEPLTPTDIEELENVLVQIGEDEGDTLLTGLLERKRRNRYSQRLNVDLLVAINASRARQRGIAEQS